MLSRVALVRTDVSEELSTTFIRVTRIGELGTTLAVTSNRRVLRRNTKALSSSETSVLTRATWCNIPEDTILHSHHRENLKSYMVYITSRTTGCIFFKLGLAVHNHALHINAIHSYTFNEEKVVAEVKVNVCP
jgi:hypothetical protein